MLAAALEGLVQLTIGNSAQRKRRTDCVFMSEHNEYFCRAHGKERTVRKFLSEAIDIGEASLATTDSRQDERQLFVSESFSINARDDEEPVHLLPQCPPSYEFNDDDLQSLQACASSSDQIDLSSQSIKEFLRDYPCPVMPQSNDSPQEKDKPSLCRSLAWSQDSMEERRVVKRCRNDELSPRLIPNPGGNLNRQNDSSPTMVHWEEKVLDPRDLVERAISYATSKNIF